MTVLNDHRRFGRAVMLSIAAAALVLVGALLAAGRTSALSGLLAGTVIAEIDAFLLGRSLSRFAASADAIGAKALTITMMSRFLTVGLMVGVIMSAKGFDPLAVVVGVLLLPAAIVAVGVTSLRRERADSWLSEPSR